MPFEKDERNLRTRLVTYPTSVRAVVIPGSDLELSLFHGVTLCNFHVAVEWRSGRVKTAQGTAPAIPCKQVLYLLGLPTIDRKVRAQRNRIFSGCGSARLVEFSRSVGDSTLRRTHVNSQDNHQALRASHNKPLVLTAKSLRALVPSLRSAAAQRRR